MCLCVYFVTVAEHSQELLYTFSKVCPCLWFPLIWNSHPQAGGLSLRLRPAAVWCPLHCHGKCRVRVGGESRHVISPSTEWEEVGFWVHLFNQYLLSNYCVPDTGLGAGFVAVNMTEIV